MICITEQTYFKLNKDNIEQYKKDINKITGKKIAATGLSAAAGGLVGGTIGSRLHGEDWNDALHNGLPLGAASGAGFALGSYLGKKLAQRRIKKYEEEQKNNKK